ncbi:MAG: 30S ribosomal protein S6 [Deltaproteobacteria bacterium]|nr:30S ribosomal protein S6 [Deltaproteobacteria bacterium]MBI2501455.1 30S ribosomal protein S6 [Deltaproteobacteria bacterium]MBI4196559.1 30S ribosomal protein S6 [Deltaproteobacteria bacterium]
MSYETVYVLRTDLSEEGNKKVGGRLSDLVARNGGKILEQKDLGIRSLAYQIARQSKGHYYQVNYEGRGNLVQEVEKNLRLTEEVLRFLTIQIPQAAKGEL